MTQMSRKKTSAFAWCALKGATTSWVQVPAGHWLVGTGAGRRCGWVTGLYRSPADNLALGGGANRRAVTCVKPEQASKGKLWTPTRPDCGEGNTIQASNRQMHLNRSTGVGGTARRDRGLRKQVGQGGGVMRRRPIPCALFADWRSLQARLCRSKMNST